MRKLRRRAGFCVIFTGVALMCGCGNPGAGEEEKESLKIGISVYDQYDTFVSQMVSSFCVIFTGVALMCGCGNPGAGEEEKESLKIGISVYDQYDTFVSQMVSSFQDYAKEKEKEWGIPITLEIKSAKNSQIVQNDQMDDFIGDNFDIVCINLVDRTDASTIIEKAKSSDIPVIFFNRELVEEDLERWDMMYYVGADAFDSAEMQREILVEVCEKNFVQNDQMDDFIGDNFDIVCINLVDRTDASIIIEKAKSNDIPVIFFNRDLVEEDLERWDKLYYVGADAFESVEMQGVILVE